MQKSRLFFILSLSVISLIMVSSCSDKGSDTPTKVSSDKEFTSMVFPSFEGITGEKVSGGTIEEGFGIISSNNNSSKGKGANIQSEDEGEHHDDGDDDHEGDDDDDDGCCYGTILHQLNLSDTQLSQIHQFKEDFENCVESAEENYETAKETVIHNANQQRKDILHQLENGTITEAQAKEQLLNLKADTQQQIAGLKAAFQAAANDCLCAFLKNIVSVLDDIQKETFITWVETSGCVNINCDLRGTAGNQQ